MPNNFEFISEFGDGNKTFGCYLYRDNAIYKIIYPQIYSFPRFFIVDIKSKTKNLILYTSLIYKDINYLYEELTFLYNIEDNEYYKYIENIEVKDPLSLSRFKSSEGIVYYETYDGSNSLFIYPPGRTEKEFNVPKEINYISFHNFKNSKYLDKLIINNKNTEFHCPNNTSYNIKEICYKNKLLKNIDRKWKLN